MNIKRLNLGCGYRHRPDWINVDGYATAPDVIVHDLHKPLPFGSESMAVAYHSHTLEHFDRAAGRRFIIECFRVLQPGGILRIALPDLEAVARKYLETLDRAADAPGDASAEADHNWMVIEMVDQLARNNPGGELDRFIAQPDLLNRDFVVSRWGAEGAAHIAGAGRQRQDRASTGRGLRLLRALRLRLGQVNRYPFFAREALLKLLLGRSYRLWAVGHYRESGDVHLWMYDRVTLHSLLAGVGFENISRCAAAESKIPEWRTAGLDLNADGSPYRPNSLYMEASKPLSA